MSITNAVEVSIQAMLPVCLATVAAFPASSPLFLASSAAFLASCAEIGGGATSLPADWAEIGAAKTKQANAAARAERASRGTIVSRVGKDHVRRQLKQARCREVGECDIC